MSNITVSPTAAAAMAGDGTNKGLRPLLANGTITFYKGTQPASPESSASGSTSYGVLTLASDVTSESNGVLTLNIASQGGILAGNGTDQPTWCRIATAGGTGLIDADCATSGGTITVAANWVMGGTIVYSGGITISVPSN